jgi:hypothetical protein
MRLVEWRALRKNSLRGFATVELPPGLVIGDVAVGASHGRAWALLPSKPMLDAAGLALRDEEGKVRYSPMLRWRDENLRSRWSDAVVSLVRAEHPGALLDESAP